MEGEPVETCGAPANLPLFPPSDHIAAHVFDTMMLGFRSFEQELRKSSSLYARQRRAQNPNIIFQDIQAQAGKGVEVLLQSMTADIAEVRPEDSSIVLQRAVNFEAGKPILCQGRQLAVIHHEADCLWLDSIADLTPGLTVAQAAHTGTTDELFEIFLHAWKEMWGRHQLVSQDRWKVILGICQGALTSP